MGITVKLKQRLIGAVAVAALIGLGCATMPAASATSQPAPAGDNPLVYPQADIKFPGNDGKPHRISWDKHSFMVDGQRLNIWSGEIHHWRSPDVATWRDLLQKLRANGYNAVSFYFFWGLHQTTENGPFDFSPGTIKDLDLLLRLAAEEGLYVIARPGPYVNAEISMGGLPAYLTNNSARLRSTAPQVLAASQQWLHAVNQIIKRHQLTTGGGSVIAYQVENELLNEGGGRAEFLTALAKQVRSDGITVPLFHNDYGLGGRFRNSAAYGLDFYAYDKYPVGFNCGAARKPIPDSESDFRRFAPNSPHFITESQGGAFTPWGAAFNTEQCYTYTDPAFTRQWGVTNIANGVTAFNFYMGFGGTNWGWTGSPSSGFTSYDYGAGITEDRQVTEKFGVQKEIGYYQRGVPQLAQMDPVEAPAVKNVQGARVKSYARQAVDPSSSVTGSGTQVLAFRLEDSNNQTDTSFTIPLVLKRSGAVSNSGFSHDDRAPQITYSGTWTQVADQTAAQGTVTRSTTVGDSAQLRFNGTGIRLITTTGTTHAPFTVQIDGGAPVRITSATVATEQNKPTQFEAYKVEDLSAGTHTITVTNQGSGTNSLVEIDAFDVLGADVAPGVEVNDTASGFWTWTGAWQHAHGQSWTAGDIGGDESFSSTAGDTASFEFTGVGFDLIGPYSGNHGSATVLVDGNRVGQTVEQVTGTAKPRQQIFSWRAPDPASPAKHVVTVKVDGSAFPGSQGTFVSLDAVRYYRNAAELPATPDAGGPGAGELGWARIPQQADTKLRLHGRDALLVTADMALAGHQLYYTTSQLFGAPIETAAGHLQYLVGVAGDDGETVLHYDSEPQVELPAGGQKHFDSATGQLRLNYRHSHDPQNLVVRSGDNTLILRIIDRQHAVKTWLLEGNTPAGLRTTAVEGVELGRTVTYAGNTVHLSGSVPAPTSVTVFPPAASRSVTWNGAQLAPVAEGMATGEVAGPQPVAPQELHFVRMADMAEAGLDYDDSKWTPATDTRAANPAQQGPGRHQGVVLDSNHYGKFEGSVWYRASYTAAASNPTIMLQGNAGSGQPDTGRAPGFMQVWVNGTYVAAVPATGTAQQLQLPAGLVTAGEPVKLAVLVHNLGQNLDWSDNGLSKQNRGLFDADLRSRGPVSWKIHGATAATAQQPGLNPSGTLYNNGGLGGELAGWHMPAFDDSQWQPATTLHSPAGVTWYRAHAPLALPAGQETAFRLQLESQRFDQGRQDHAQATIFVNGWNTGVYIGDIGPQTSFTVPRGFLNPNGDNVIAVAVAAKADTMGPERIRLVPVHTTTLRSANAVPEPGSDEDSQPAPADGKVDTGTQTDKDPDGVDQGTQTEDQDEADQTPPATPDKPVLPPVTPGNSAPGDTADGTSGTGANGADSPGADPADSGQEGGRAGSETAGSSLGKGHAGGASTTQPGQLGAKGQAGQTSKAGQPVKSATPRSGALATTGAATGAALLLAAGLLLAGGIAATARRRA